jgi:hypothetical protein
MPAERIAMRQVRDVLRLKTAGVGSNEIARRVGVAPSTVRLTLKRLAVAGLSWPLPAELSDAALETQLFTAVGTKQGHRRRAEPDWAVLHRELRRKHVTLQMLWDEYIERFPEGYPTFLTAWPFSVRHWRQPVTKAVVVAAPGRLQLLRVQGGERAPRVALPGWDMCRRRRCLVCQAVAAVSAACATRYSA